MSRKTLLPLLCLAACLAACGSGADNPIQARSGTWRGETGFGSFSFTICEGGRKITAYSLDYRVGNAVKLLTLGGGPEVAIDDDGSFDLSTPEEGVTFRGRFAADGKSVRGVWEVAPDGAPPGGGKVLSEEWALER
jgi:hypothetical protein